MNAASKQQLFIVDHDGDMFIDACPGAGKTSTMGIRTRRLLAEGKRVALISFTNTAAEEMLTAAMGVNGIGQRSEMFAGTLHSLAYRYILIPFAHLVTGCQGPPYMDDQGLVTLNDRVAMWSRDWEFDVDGDVSTITRASAAAKNCPAQRIKNKKIELARMGYIQLQDAIYWAIQVLDEYPILARALASRFEEVIVDECQDCNVLQLRLIEILKNSGLQSLVFIGDLDQSIYKFQNAAPNSVINFVKKNNLEPIPLRTNFRSSNSICRLANELIADDSRSNKAVSVDGRPERDPLLVRVSPTDQGKFPGFFMRRLLAEGVDDASDGKFGVSVLARNNATISVLRGSHRPASRSLVDMLYGISLGVPLVLDNVKALEGEIKRKLVVSNEDLSVSDMVLREFIGKLRLSLPAPTGLYSEWASAAVTVLNSELERWFGDGSLFPQQVVPRNLASALIQPIEDKGSTERDMDFMTIHSAKGITRDAVFILLDPASAAQREACFNGFADDVAQDLICGTPLSESEDLRMFYVALTRARHSVVVGVPDYFTESHVSAFVNLGFTDLGKLCDLISHENQ